MPKFDIIAAKNAGYTDAEIADHMGQKFGFNTAAARQAGYSDQEIIGGMTSRVDVGADAGAQQQPQGQSQEQHWYDPVVNFGKDIASTVAEAPLIPIKMGRGLNKAIGNFVDYATTDENATPEEQANAQKIREALTPGTQVYDEAEKFWKPKVESAQAALATPPPVNLLEKTNKIMAQGIGAAIKLAPALPFGVTGMAAQGSLENYDQNEDVGQAVVEGTKSALSMKAMGATKAMGVGRSVATVSGISGADAFVTTLAKTGDLQASIEEGAKAAVQMAAMDIINRGAMPHGGAVHDQIYNEVRKRGISEEIADNLAQRAQEAYDTDPRINFWYMNQNNDQDLLHPDKNSMDGNADVNSIIAETNARIGVNAPADQQEPDTSFMDGRTGAMREAIINPAAPDVMRERALQDYPVQAGENASASLDKIPAAPVDIAAHDAATSPANDIPQPTPAQIEAGNYKKGHVNIHGLDVSIENPHGSTRSGVDEQGNPWETTMNDHYGYIKGTVGKDKDHIDVFLNPGKEHADTDSVFVIDQINPQTGKLDEHKVMIGYGSMEDARAAYLRNYDQTGINRIGKISEATVPEFKQWLKDGNTKQAYKPVKTKEAANGTAEAGQRGQAGNEAGQVQPEGRGEGEQGQGTEANAAQANAENAPENLLGQGQPDRRKDSERRKQVAEMTPDELRRELLTDHLTGLPNDRAFDEADKTGKTVASLDVSGLKYINDNYGHKAGDDLIKAVANVLREHGIDAYRKGEKGDEFAALLNGDTAALDKAQKALADKEIIATLPDGREIGVKGWRLDYGHGQDHATADADLYAKRKAAEDAGNRNTERGGKPHGLVEEEKLSEGNHVQGRVTAEELDKAGVKHDVNTKQEIIVLKDGNNRALRGKDGTWRVTEDGPRNEVASGLTMREALDELVGLREPEGKTPPTAADGLTPEPKHEGYTPAEVNYYTKGSTPILLDEIKPAYEFPKELIPDNADDIRESIADHEATIENVGPKYAEEIAKASPIFAKVADRYDELRTSKEAIRTLKAKLAELTSKETGKQQEPKADLGTVEQMKTPALAEAIREKLAAGEKINNKLALKKLVADLYGVKPGELDKHWKAVEEAYEYATIKRAREIATGEGTFEEKLAQIKEMYENQPNLNQRDSMSVKNQQYSTPAPLAYIMQHWLGIDIAGKLKTYEPTAGNGMLVFAADPKSVHANELDAGYRSAHLADQGFKETTGNDALEGTGEKKYDRVTMNPPFGATSAKEYDGFKTVKLEHQIALESLNAMKDDGRATLIIGGHNFKDGKMTETDRIFLNYLYSHYNVEHNIDINGDVYKGQGTTFPIRLITIEGRKAEPDQNYAPRDPAAYQKAETFDDVAAILNGGESNDIGARSGSAGEGLAGEGGQRGGNGDRTADRGEAGRGAGPGDNAGNDSGENSVSDNQRPSADRSGSRSGEIHGGNEDTARIAGGNESVRTSERDRTAGERQPLANLSAEKQARAQELRQRIREKLGQVNMGVDPQLIIESAELAALHIESGLRTFKEVATALVRDFGNAIKPYLKDIYNKTRSLAGVPKEELTPREELRGLDIEDVLADYYRSLEKQQEKAGADANSLQTPYQPKSQAKAGNNLTPKNMAVAIEGALDRIAEEHGSVDDYVAKKLGFSGPNDLYTKENGRDRLSAEQIDAIALGIDAIDRGEGMIIGDQTGVGKGRVAASIIRYANQQGKVPIFFTEKAKLFSDMHRDLTDIGHDVEPLIMSGNEDADIVDSKNNVVFKKHGGMGKKTNDLYNDISEGGQSFLKNNGYGVVLTTYSQVQNPGRQRAVLRRLAQDNIVILDESHNAAGQSATGEFLRELLENASGVLYSSATFAKRPDTMPIYFRSKLGSSGLSMAELIKAIEMGGVPLQQIISKQLADAGHYIRREQDFSQIEKYVTKIDHENKDRDYKQADRITKPLRDIVEFSRRVNDLIDWNQVAAENGHVAEGGDLEDAVTSTEFSSTVHNLIQQMLLSVKADAVAEEAIAALKEGRKPVIGLMNTMGSFLDDVMNAGGIKVGEPVGFMFNDVLLKALRNTLRYNVKDERGKSKQYYMSLDQLQSMEPGLYDLYTRLEDKIQRTKMDIPASPIDYIRHRIEQEGFKTGEITGRQLYIDHSKEIPTVESRSSAERNRNNAVNGYNNGGVDALVINRAGSTGLSLHPTELTEDKRPRRMVLAQADLNIDTVVQMLGRIFRKGQIEKPEYVMMQSALPAEIRPSAVLEKKLKSMNANTSADSESAYSSKDTPDMLNRYGDSVTEDWLRQHRDVNFLLGDPLRIAGEGNAQTEDAFKKVSGKIALLPASVQEEFYHDVTREYSNLIDYLNSVGQNELVAQDLDYKAETQSRTLIHSGTDEANPFAASTYLEKVLVNEPKKPHLRAKVEEMVAKELDGKDPIKHAQDMQEELRQKTVNYLNDLREKIREAEAEEKPTAGLEAKLQEASTNYAQVSEALDTYRVGSTHDLVITDDGYSTPAVVTGFRIAEGQGSPVAPSKIKVNFAVTDPLQTISIPFTKRSLLLASRYMDSGIIHDWDSRVAHRDAKTTRYIITGNLLAGFQKFDRGQGRPTIINYTDQDGSIKQGIQVPRSMERNIDSIFNERTVDTETAYNHIIDAPTTVKILRSGDGNVRVVYQPRGGEYRIYVPGSKQKGGKYFLDDQLINLVSEERGFADVPGMMRGQKEKAAHVSPENLRAALDRLGDLGVRFSIPTQAEAVEQPERRPGEGILLDNLGLQQAYEMIVNSKTAQAALAPLQRIANHLLASGKEKFADFRAALKETLGKAWDKVGIYTKKVYDEAVRVLKDKRGSVVLRNEAPSLDDAITAQPEEGSDLDRMLAAHYNSDDRLRTMAEVVLTHTRPLSEQQIRQVIDGVGLASPKAHLLSKQLAAHWHDLNGKTATPFHAQKINAALDRTKEALQKVPGAKTAADAFGEAWDAQKSTFAPFSRGNAALLTAETLREQMGVKAQAMDHFKALLDEAARDENRNLTIMQKARDIFQSAGGTLADTVMAKLTKEQRIGFRQWMDTGEMPEGAHAFEVTPELEKIAGVIREMFTEKVNAVQELGTGVLQNVREYYFPHIWKKGEAAGHQVASLMSKRPLEGSKSFTKQRIYDDILAGIEAGHETISDNPLDEVFLKMHEMDKYLMAHRTLKVLQDAGLARWVSVLKGKAPAGWVKLNDRFGTKWRPTYNKTEVYTRTNEEAGEMGPPRAGRFNYNVDLDKEKKITGYGKAAEMYLPPEVARVLNNYLSESLYMRDTTGNSVARGTIGGTPFKVYMAAANRLNEFQLGAGSMFHAGFTSLEAVITHGALGFHNLLNGNAKESLKYFAEAPVAWATMPRLGDKVYQEWLKPGSNPELTQIVEGLKMAGARKELDARFQSKATQKMLQNLSDQQYIRAAARTPFVLMEQMARPIMEWLVPRQKFGVFAELAKDWMDKNPETSHEEMRSQMQYLWNRVDSRLGQVAYDRIFMNNVGKNLVQALIRAPGWTGGTILEVGGGILDVGKTFTDLAQGKKAEVSHRTAYVLSMLATTAVANALLTAGFHAARGQALPNDWDWRDLFSFRTGNIDEHGNPERFMLPTYAKDIYAYVKNGIPATLLHKAHPILSVAGEMIKNRDYYGTEIYHEDDNFAQIAADLGLHGVKAFEPFYIRGIKKEVERGGDALGIVAPLVGVMPAPAAMNRTAAEERVAELMKANMPQGSKTKEQFEKSQLRSKVLQDFRRHDPDAKAELAQALQEGKLTPSDVKLIAHQIGQSPFMSALKRLSLDQLQSVYTKANPEERKLIEMVYRGKAYRAARRGEKISGLDEEK